MKSAHRSTLLCSIPSLLLLAIACGSHDTSGLFSPSGGDSGLSAGGSLDASGGSAHAGQSAGGQSGSASNRAGSSGSSSVAGQGTSAGGAGMTGSGVGGMNVSGNAGAPSGGGVGAGGSHAGSGGSSAGGVSGGSGGTAGGAGGTTGSSGGTAGSAAGPGGSGGSSGSGGAAAGCPMDGPPPQDGDVCTTPTPDNCFYSGKACSCVSDAQAAARHWSCYGTPGKCPASGDVHPVDGTSCKGFNGGLCPYAADDFCVCVPPLGGPPNTEPKWSCSPKNPTCPDMGPTIPFCGNVKECSYGDRACFCASSTWTCQ